MSEVGQRERVNALLAEVNRVSKVLVHERTAYSSQLILSLIHI